MIVVMQEAVGAKRKHQARHRGRSLIEVSTIVRTPEGPVLYFVGPLACKTDHLQARRIVTFHDLVVGCERMASPAHAGTVIADSDSGHAKRQRVVRWNALGPSETRINVVALLDLVPERTLQGTGYATGTDD
jgi:hypothetical protein